MRNNSSTIAENAFYPNLTSKKKRKQGFVDCLIKEIIKTS